MPISTPDRDPSAVASASFSVPAETVWQYRLDFSNLPQYNPDVNDIAQIEDGQRVGEGGAKGPGARYSFTMSDAGGGGGGGAGGGGGGGAGQPVELWIVDAVPHTLVAAGMKGGSEAYEEFVVLPQGAQACEATLMLWITLPDGLTDDIVAAASASGLAQIEKEMRLMKEVLEGRAGSS